MLAQPHRNALLRLFLLITRETPARLSAAVLEKPLDAFVTSAGHAKVTRVDRSREVEAMILLVPMPKSALDDLDGLAWLGKLPPHRASISLKVSGTGIIGRVYVRVRCVYRRRKCKEPKSAENRRNFVYTLFGSADGLQRVVEVK
jgi:hypothetical protein